MKRWSVAVLVSVLMVGGLAACSDDEKSSSTATTTAAPGGTSGGSGGEGETIALPEWQELVNSACAELNEQSVGLSVTNAQDAEQLSSYWESMTETIKNAGLPNEMTAEAETWLQDIEAIGEKLDEVVESAQSGTPDSALSTELESLLAELSDASQKLGVDECSSNNSQAGGTGATTSG